MNLEREKKQTQREKVLKTKQTYRENAQTQREKCQKINGSKYANIERKGARNQMNIEIEKEETHKESVRKRKCADLERESDKPNKP